MNKNEITKRNEQTIHLKTSRILSCFSSYVPNGIRFPSFCRTNMNVCLPHLHEACYAMHLQSVWTTTTIGGISVTCFFKGTTIHYKFKNRIESPQASGCQLSCYPLNCPAAIVGILELSFFPKTKQHDMPSVGIKLATLRFLSAH